MASGGLHERAHRGRQQLDQLSALPRRGTQSLRNSRSSAVVRLLLRDFGALFETSLVGAEAGRQSVSGAVYGLTHHIDLVVDEA